MTEWKLLTGEAKLKEIISPVRRSCRGHFCSNYQFLNSTTDKDLEHTWIRYAVNGDNIYILKKEDSFCKLSYAAGDIENFGIFDLPDEAKGDTLCCDIVELEGKEKQSVLAQRLIDCGFSVYKKYHMWECTEASFQNAKGQRSVLEEDITRKLRLSGDKSIEYMEKIYEIFDPYADMLPLRSSFKEYIDNAYAVSCFDKERFVGSYIYRVSGSTALGEYVYAVNSISGTGGRITNGLLDICFDKHHVNKVYTWICDTNTPSIRMHEKAGFTVTNQYKTTFML